MRRRQFATTLLGAGAALVLPRPLLALSRHVSATRGLTSAAPIINGVRLNARLAELARIGARSDGGVDRVEYSDHDIAARAWIEPLLQQAGLTVRRDTDGNIPGLGAVRPRDSTTALSDVKKKTAISFASEGGSRMISAVSTRSSAVRFGGT